MIFKPVVHGVILFSNFIDVSFEDTKLSVRDLEFFNKGCSF